jgi:hypothetical protein
MCDLFICTIHIGTASLTLLPYLAYVLPNAVSLNKNEDNDEEYGAAAAVVGASALPPAAPPAPPPAGAAAAAVSGPPCALPPEAPPTAPPASAAAAAVGGPPAVPQAGGLAGIPVNCGVQGVGAGGQLQAGIAVAGAVLTKAGLHGHNPNQALLMAQMNHNFNQGMVQMRAFMPTESEHQQTCIKSAITSAYAHLATSKAQGRNTAMFEQQINCLEIQLDAILNALWLFIFAYASKTTRIS